MIGRWRGWGMHASALALGVALSLAVPGDAGAHGALKRSEPARAARLTTAPRELRLTFTETPVLGFTRILFTGPAGAVRLGALRLDSALAVVGAIEGPLVEGSYTVEWQIAGKDDIPCAAGLPSRSCPVRQD